MLKSCFHKMISVCVCVFVCMFCVWGGGGEGYKGSGKMLLKHLLKFKVHI
jgi:hypothetical protein